MLKENQNVQKNATEVPQVVKRWSQGSPRAPKIDSEIDANLMKIRSGGGLGHFISDFGFQGVSGGARGTDFRSKADAKSCKTKLGK